MLYQVHSARPPSSAPRWHSRRVRQVLHSIPHYLEELRDIESWQEAVDWLYFKTPYLFKLRDFPIRVTVEFTNHCNFGCGYCPRSLMDRPLGNMDLRFFESLVKQLDAGGCAVLKIGGLGEPVLHPEFSEMMPALDTNRMKSFIYTNGTLLQQCSPEQICSWNVNSVVLSIDGLDASSFEKQRKGGNYSKVRTAAQAFSSFRHPNKPIFEVRHVILPNETSADLRGFKRDWLQLADRVKFNYLLPLFPRGAAVPGKVHCRDIRREAYVRWDGRMLLCAGQDRQHPPEWLGNANQQPISEMWFAPRIEELRAAHNSHPSELPACCKNCSFR